jgi:spore germination cell wall hydrolase CwlJ-like protein
MLTDKLLLAAVFLLASSPAAADDERLCLAEALYFEARDQGTIGMMAVGVVIQNRVGHKKYPDTICGVVRQGRYWNGNPIRDKCQFSYWCDGRPERPYEKDVWEEAQSVAELLLITQVDIGLDRVTHYHASWVTPGWSKVLEFRTRIGQHIFYAEEQ